MTPLRRIIHERNIYRRAWRALAAIEEHASAMERGRGLLAEDPNACQPCLRAIAQRLRREPEPELGCAIWIERDAAVAAVIAWEARSRRSSTTTRSASSATCCPASAAASIEEGVAFHEVGWLLIHIRAARELVDLCEQIQRGVPVALTGVSVRDTPVLDCVDHGPPLASPRDNPSSTSDS